MKAFVLGVVVTLLVGIGGAAAAVHGGLIPVAAEQPDAAVPLRPGDVGAALFAALSQEDADAVLGLLDPQVLVFETGGVEASVDEYAGHHLPADMAFAAGMQSTLLSQRVFEMGDFALVANYTRLHGEYQGEPTQRLSTETLLLRRQDDGWRIAHIHWSSRAEP